VIEAPLHPIGCHSLDNTEAGWKSGDGNFDDLYKFKLT
jgi:hypothetical protein